MSYLVSRVGPHAHEAMRPRLTGSYAPVLRGVLFGIPIAAALWASMILIGLHLV
jgi:hypothetical protein